MDCDICSRAYDAARRPFLCPVDARNHVYEGRLKNLQFMIENEELQNKVNQLLEGSTSPTRATQDTLQAQQRRAEDRTTQILAAADKLRDDIKAAKEQIRAQKAALAKRKSDLAAVTGGIAERRAKQQEEMDKSIKRTRYRWGYSAEDMARTRAFLCKEAASLYGLKRSMKGSAARYEYSLGGIPIVDLTSLNTLSPELVSTSLAHISHILILASHYLSIRLPAAITLPHRDYPRPTIFNLTASYIGTPLPSFPSFSGIATPPSNKDEPISQRAPRPRPLFIDKPLPTLSKEDPSTYSYFLEGVTLLAYNIAWACCTQGISMGEKASFEDLCDMGRNLYNLLIAQQTEGGRHYPGDITAKSPNTETGDSDIQAHWLGRFSHATTFYFLGGAEGTELSRTFKLPAPIKLADKLKKKLASDAPVVDWEVLDDDAWKVEGSAMQDVAELQKPSDKDKATEGKSSPHRGSSGWMKVKNR